MGDPHVREIGKVGAVTPIVVGIARGRVTIGRDAARCHLTVEQADELASLLITALWQAAAQGGAGHG